MAKTKEKLMIIDGNALIHRSFHALPPTMTTKNGQMVNAVYGFASFLIKAIGELKPEYVVLTLDKKGPTFRHKKFKEYKAKRVKAPDELYTQIPIVKEIAKGFNIPIFEQDGFEADDLIGTISKIVDPGIEKIIVTGDMDTLQLVNEHTRIYAMSRGISDSIVYDITQVKQRFGVGPKQIIDYKALRGDPSDNIPGVRGVGEKTAVELLKKYKTLDGIYKALEEKEKLEGITPRIAALLKEYKKDAYLSYELATIKCDIKLKFNLEDARFININKQDVIDILSKLEFKSLLPRTQKLLNELSGIKSAEAEAGGNKFARNKKDFQYFFIDNNKDFDIFLNKIKKENYFTFDTETSGFDPITAKLLGISFSWKEGEAYYLNIASENINKDAHNAKFDIRALHFQGIEVRGLDFDTMIASYLLNPGSRGHGLDPLTFSEFRFEKISKEDLLGKGKDKITFSEVEAENLGIYSCEDADFTHRLISVLAPRLKKQKLEKLFREIEIPLIEVLAVMEDNGIEIDKKFLGIMSKKIGKKILELEEKIHKQAGIRFNIKSTKQLKEILFEKLDIPIMGIKKTKTGFSTAFDELEKIKGEHPIILLIQEYRELTKLTSTYIDSLPQLINKKTGRVHTSFNQTITATGRLSSTNPNLQNIPIRTKLGREIRKAFVAPGGYKLLALDYSQIELRLAAHMSEDKKMIDAFLKNADIHTSTSAEINQVNPDTVTKEMRREAKAINFGILYGQGAHGLSRSADIPYWRAKEFIEQYFIVYKGIKKFIDTSIESAREKGYAETLFGRRRLLPEINSSVAMVRKGAERMAINTPLQGTSADITKIAMIEAQKYIDKNFPNGELKKRLKKLKILWRE